jgi:hypothetical protein
MVGDKEFTTRPHDDLPTDENRNGARMIRRRVSILGELITVHAARQGKM